MKIQLSFDEVIAGVGHKAGEIIPVTIANADECLGLAQVLRVNLIDDAKHAGVIGLRADFETPFADAMRALGVASFSKPPYYYPAFADAVVIAEVQSSLAGSPNLVDNAGGIVSLQGRRLYANLSITPGSYSFTIAIGASQRSFTLQAGASITLPVGVKTQPAGLIPQQIVIDPTTGETVTVHREGRWAPVCNFYMQRILLGAA